MPSTSQLATQDARKRPINIANAHTVVYAIYGDSNAAGNDSTQGTLPSPAGSVVIDWSARVLAGEVPNIGGLGLNPNIGIWNKWTLGADAARSSDAATGTGWHPGDCGLFDHGGAVYRGTGQFARANSIEQSFGLAMRRALLEDGVPAGEEAPSPFQLSLVKYGVSGSVVNPTPANPQSGWYPSGAPTGAFNILTTRYLRPAIQHRLTEAGDAGPPVYFGGSVVILGGTDAIEPAGPFTAPGDAEAVDGNLQAVVQGVNNFVGVPKAPVVLVIPPIVQENAASNFGYPNMPIVRERVAALARRRNAAGYPTVAVELGQFERVSDYLHYSNLGLWYAGRECARAMLSMGHQLQQLTEAP